MHTNEIDLISVSSLATDSANDMKKKISHMIQQKKNCMCRLLHICLLFGDRWFYAMLIWRRRRYDAVVGDDPEEERLIPCGIGATLYLFWGTIDLFRNGRLSECLARKLLTCISYTYYILPEHRLQSTTYRYTNILLLNNSGTTL
jgi:hypothetical protein